MGAITIKKVFLHSLVCLAVAAFATGIVLFEYWAYHSPTAPRSDAGEVYQLNNHGSYFYVTQNEGRLYYGLVFWAAPLLFFSAVALNTRWKVVRTRDDLPKRFY